MKTTLDINDTLLAAAKGLAAQQRTTLTRLIEEGLQLRLGLQKVRMKHGPLPVFSGEGGMCRGVDGLSNKAMLAAADHDA